MSPPSSAPRFSAFELRPQAVYRVVAPFGDYDGKVHGIGECWKFLRKDFLPYEDGLSLFVEHEGREVQIRLQCSAEAQGHIVQTFSEFVEAA
jgi:hypothetical protein